MTLGSQYKSGYTVYGNDTYISSWVEQSYMTRVSVTPHPMSCDHCVVFTWQHVKEVSREPLTEMGKKKKKAEAERETDYVWLLMSDPITFISWRWWTHTDYWRQWNSNLNILQFSSEGLSVCEVRMCVRVRLHSLLLLFLVTNAPDCFVFFGIALMWSHTHTHRQRTTWNTKHTRNLQAINWKN